MISNLEFQLKELAAICSLLLTDKSGGSVPREIRFHFSHSEHWLVLLVVPSSPTRSRFKI